MEGDQRVDVDIADSIAVGQQEFLVLYELSNPSDTSAGHRMETSVSNSDTPTRFVVFAVIGKPTVTPERYGEVPSVGLIVQKKILYNLAFVTNAQHKVFVSIIGIRLHDVPQYRERPDGDHGLGDVLRHVSDSSTEPTGENHNLHVVPPPRLSITLAT
jgi:hypothetical protein